MVGLIATLLCATPGPCQATWPIECDTSEGWEAKPDWVPNPSESATVRASNGVITFAVSEPGRGMKWTLPVRRLSAELPGYLLVRAHSSGIVASGGYVLHTFDDDEGGAVIRPGDFPSDGQWHDIAVDLFHAGMRGAIEGIAVEVQARDGKAELSFDSLGPVAVPPPGATIVPGGARDDRAVTITFDEPLEFRPRYDWLGNPADEGDHLIEQADGHVKMTVTTPGRGMKWSTQLAEPIDLTGMAYVTIRYRAKGIATWGDYFVYAGSATGGAPPQTANLVRGTDIRADGRWHAETLRVEDLFPVKELAFQLQAGTPDAVAETSSLAFSTRRPLMNVADAFSYSEGWGESATASRSFTPVDLAGVVDTSGSDVARSFGLNDWLPAGRITAEGVPFELVEDRMALVPPGGGRVLEIPIGASARELILLMAARLPSEDLSGMLGGRPLRSFSQPERLRIGVERVDGSTDWMFPARVYDGAYQFSAGFDAYSLPELGDAPIANLHVRSAMTEATIGVLAVTANHAGPLTQPRPVAYLPPLAEPKHVKQTPPRLTVDGNSLTLGNAHLEARFDVGDGISLANLQHKNLAGGELRLAPGPIFSISVDDVTVRSTDVTVGEPTRNPSRAEASIAVPFDAQPAGLPFTGTLRVALGSGPDLAMSLDLRHVGDDTIRPGVSFPQLTEVVMGDHADTWYMHSGRGGVISNRPARSSEAYAGRNPLQIMDVFSPQARGGLYLMVRDLDDIYKHFTLSKTDEGVLAQIDYFRRDYGPGEKIEIAPAVIGAHTGDWRVALDAYKQWVSTWYEPQVPRKQWFNECFNYRQHLVRGGLFDFGAGEYRMDEALREDIDFFGRVDYFHIFDFGQSDTFGRVGDYTHYDEIGGRTALAAAIQGVQDEGVRVGLYIEGYLVDERGDFGRDHVEPWHIIKRDGGPLLWNGAPLEHMMCPAVAGWQDYLAATYERVTGELTPDGMYIDQHGFADAWKICHSPDHGHPVPMPPLRGEREMDEKIRAAVPEHMATLTEEVPTDVNSQYQDGALGYSVAQANSELSPHRIQLFRFCFPGFKIFQLVSYNPFVEGGWELLKFPFFNGEGTWLGNSIPGGFGADAQAFLRKSFAILHEHRDAFTSSDVEPLVPTDDARVCANRFATDGKTIWTLINMDYRTYRGPALTIPHVKGARYIDVWNEREIAPRIKGKRAEIPVEIGPREVGCVAQILGG